MPAVDLNVSGQNAALATAEDLSSGKDLKSAAQKEAAYAAAAIVSAAVPVVGLVLGYIIANWGSPATGDGWWETKVQNAYQPVYDKYIELLLARLASIPSRPWMFTDATARPALAAFMDGARQRSQQNLARIAAKQPIVLDTQLQLSTYATLQLCADMANASWPPTQEQLVRALGRGTTTNFFGFFCNDSWPQGDSGGGPGGPSLSRSASWFCPYATNDGWPVYSNSHPPQPASAHDGKWHLLGGINIGPNDNPDQVKSKLNAATVRLGDVAGKIMGIALAKPPLGQKIALAKPPVVKSVLLRAHPATPGWVWPVAAISVAGYVAWRATRR